MPFRCGAAGTCYCPCEYKSWWHFRCRSGKHCGKHNKGCHVKCSK